MKRALSVFVAFVLVVSFTASLNVATARAANGMSITLPTDGSTIVSSTLSVSGIFSSSQPAGYKVQLNVAANSISKTYTYALPAAQSSWGPISVLRVTLILQ